MNKRGTPKNLIPSHPGNLNAVRHGVYSPRLMEARAVEIETTLNDSYDFSVFQRFAVSEFAHVLAIREAIDRDLDQRGVVDKHGEPRNLLVRRSRISREVDHWLSEIVGVMERQATAGHPRREHGDYVLELERIAFATDPKVSPRDRITALRELMIHESAPPPPGFEYTQKLRQMSDEALKEELQGLAEAVNDLEHEPDRHGERLEPKLPEREDEATQQRSCDHERDVVDAHDGDQAVSESERFPDRAAGRPECSEPYHGWPDEPSLT